jgi:RNA-dependent RNA polymerase
MPLVKRTLNAAYEASGAENRQAEGLHIHFACEMRHICVTHTLVDSPDILLKEEEVILGTILANCTQSRWRSDWPYRMKLHAE